MPKIHSPIHDHIDQIISRAHSEHFEDGMISQFEQEILRLYVVNPPLVLGVFLASLDHEHGETLAEGIKILSRIDDRKTSYIRRRFIHDHVYYKEAGVRDAAISAIEILEDFRSIPVLKEYIEWETEGWLKRYAEQILSEFLSGIDPEAIAAAVAIRAVIKPRGVAEFKPVEVLGVSLSSSLVVPVPGRPPVTEFY